MTQLAEPGTIAIPEATSTQTATSIADCDRAVADVKAHAKEWFQATPAELIPLLHRLSDAMGQYSQEMADAAADAKQLPAGPLRAEDWSHISVTNRYLTLLAASLEDIAAGRRPQPPAAAHPVAGDRTAIPVFPVNGIDKMAMTGFSAEIWLRPGVSANQAMSRQATAWFGGGKPGVSLVLGAGNVSAIPATDALDRLFIARHPVVLKMNPVNDYLGPIFAKVFRDLIDRGVMRIVYGGADVGEHLVRHPDVDDVHVTGSDKTYEAIVFGGGSEGARRKAAHNPAVTKPVTGELGNVSPLIVVPGPWTDKDVNFQAQNIASMLTNNAGFNCIAVRAIIMQSSWQQRDALLSAVRDVLKNSPQRHPYYPGARDRWQRFIDAHPDAERYGDDSAGCVPWTMIPGLRPGGDDEIAFTTEAFNGVFGEVSVDADSTVDFIRKAVDFSNDGLWGTLGCSLIVHPKSMKDPAVSAAVEQAIAELRYGTVAVNHWSALGFLLASTTWGAYPGHTVDDVQSGIGIVHNSLMYDEADVEKSVVRGPFRMPVKPIWFGSHKNAEAAAQRFAELQRKPTAGRLLKTVAAAIRG